MNNKLEWPEFLEKYTELQEEAYAKNRIKSTTKASKILWFYSSDYTPLQTLIAIERDRVWESFKEVKEALDL